MPTGDKMKKVNMNKYIHNTLIEFLLNFIIILFGFFVGASYKSFLQNWDLVSEFPTQYQFINQLHSSNNEVFAGVMLVLLTFSAMTAILTEE